MNQACPICFDLGTNKIMHLNDKRHTQVFRCDICDFEFLETWSDPLYVKSLYEGDKYIFKHNISSEDSYLKYDEYKVRYEWMKPYLNKNCSVLEIGCGDGKFINMIKGLVGEIEGVELSPPQVNLLRNQGIKCYDTMIDEMEPTKTYDVICMFALLEHVPNVTNFLQSIKNYIKKNSYIFIEVPNLYNSLVSSYKIDEFKEFYYRQEHLYYFTPKSLQKLFNKNGFNIKIHTSQQASLTNHMHWIHNKFPQPDANAMTSAKVPAELNNNFPIEEILDKTDDFYRQLLISHEMGDLLAARIKLR